eukprot:scaffold412_cov311-Pavlova_lutheri.AAC.20
MRGGRVGPLRVSEKLPWVSCLDRRSLTQQRDHAPLPSPIQGETVLHRGRPILCAHVFCVPPNSFVFPLIPDPTSVAHGGRFW